MNHPLSLTPFLRRLAPLALAACSLGAIAAEPPAAPLPKTHWLFMGSNLSVVSKGDMFPVRDVKDNAFVVKGAHGDLVIQVQDRQFRLKIDDALKVTTTFVNVEKLNFERVYTPGNDPMTKFADTARAAAALDDGQDLADAAVRQAGVAVDMNRAGLATANAQAISSPGPGAAQAVASATANLNAAAAAAVSAQQAADVAQSLTGMDAFSTVSSSSRMTSELAAEAYDAIRVSFTVSAPKPVTTPYAVIFMRFLADKDRPETATVWVYAEKLPDLDERPHPVMIMRGGFPPGYHIASYQVHIYAGTTEIATNVSRKELAMTEDEAFQYHVIEYVTKNREQTLAPTPAPAFWPTDLSAHLTVDKLNRALFVKVRKDGKATGFFEDEACTQVIDDPAFAAVLPDLRFQPALAKGKPAEGVIALELGRP